LNVLTIVITYIRTDKYIKVSTKVRTMEGKIQKIGNSLGFILPKGTLDLMGLKEGDPITFDTKEEEINMILKKKTVI
jgi:siroheme synthase